MCQEAAIKEEEGQHMIAQMDQKILQERPPWSKHNFYKRHLPILNISEGMIEMAISRKRGKVRG